MDKKNFKKVSVRPLTAFMDPYRREVLVELEDKPVKVFRYPVDVFN